METPSAAEPDEVVCECKGVTRSDIESLLPSCVDRNAIGKACGAGTVCGACLPRIDEIAGRGSAIEATLIEVHRLEVGIARFRFRPRSTESWALGPGAWISVQALVAGRWIARPYTVVAAGPDGCLDIIVKREPLGLFSRWLHDFATPDSSFRLSKPQTSRREPGGDRVLFIAGGIGITPAFLEASLGHHRTLSIHWALRDAKASHFAAVVGANMRLLNAALHIHDTTVDGRQENWGTLYPPSAADTVVVCGPPGFQHGVTLDLRAAGWTDDRITIESFGPQRPSASVIHHAESFDYRHETVVAESFHLRPAHSVSDALHRPLLLEVTPGARLPAS